MNTVQCTESESTVKKNERKTWNSIMSSRNMIGPFERMMPRISDIGK